MARRSEAAALMVEHLTFAEDGSATALIARSKTDQEGAGAVRWLSPRTAAALRSWLDCAGLATGPVFRAIRKNGVAKPSPLETGDWSSGPPGRLPLTPLFKPLIWTSFNIIWKFPCLEVP